ncbi:MAG: XdhC family protein [Chitinophagaceae bacterium]
MKNIATWKLIDRSLKNGIAVMLLYVLESKGSSPGRQGFFMAINAEGAMVGSIGGGIMEHKFAEMAKEQLTNFKGQSEPANIQKQLHNKTAPKNQSGMICSGEQTILLYHIQNSDKSTIQNLINSLEQNKNGTLHFFPGGLKFSDTIPPQDFYFDMHSENEWEYKEKTGHKNFLSIIGGGHCALALSVLMQSMDFFIRVYDDRKNLRTMEENNTAHEKHFIGDYSQLSSLIPSDNNHYLVIMTQGYRSDDIAIRALAGKKFKYIGVLGSSHKIQKMLDEYKKESIDPDWLKNIQAPAGLSIKSQTPEEIAVSIAAEIIKIKNQ